MNFIFTLVIDDKWDKINEPVVIDELYVDFFVNLTDHCSEQLSDKLLTLVRWKNVLHKVACHNSFNKVCLLKLSVLLVLRKTFDPDDEQFIDDKLFHSAAPQVERRAKDIVSPFNMTFCKQGVGLEKLSDLIFILLMLLFEVIHDFEDLIDVNWFDEFL